MHRRLRPGLTGCVALAGLLLAAGCAGAAKQQVAAKSYEVPANSPVADALRRAAAAVQTIVAVPDKERTFDNTVGAIDDLITRLRLDTELVQFMAYVSTDEAERERGRLAEEHVRDWFVELGKREDLYRAVKSYAGQPESGKLTPEQQRLLEHTLRDYRRSGMELPAEQRAELKQLELEENKLSLEFEKNVRDDATRVPLTAAELAGVPEDMLRPIPRSGDLYLVGLDQPTYFAVMTYADSETTRHKLFLAFKRQGGRENITLLERILALRARQAQLLGYPTVADYAAEIRMAKNAATVLKFYDDLRPLIRRKAKLDFDEFTAAKREVTHDAAVALQAWDQFHCENWLLKNRYAVDALQVREYFPMDRVLAGLFQITQTLYGIEYRDVTAQAATRGRPLWHADVKLYEVWDKARSELLGEMYLDPFPRENKYNHFAQFGLLPRKVWNDGTVQRPLVALVCNFPPPTPDQPSLMTHEDVQTLFHEFGHAMHSLLTQVHYGSFSGTATARDFVEMPSQLFENWARDPAVLKTFARHYRTGAPLPDELLAAMVKAKNVGSGLRAERQVFYGLVDLRYNMVPDGKVDTTKIGLATMAETEQFRAAPETYFQAGFQHLIGYGAGYYSYMWAEVYAQDMFTRFRQQGPLNPAIGMEFRDKVLSRGGSVEEMDMLTGFLGREPRMAPFLEHLGLTAK